MFKKEYVKTKVISFILCNLALCLVFFILVPERNPNPDFLDFYGLEQLLVYYPLLSAFYGVTVMLTCRGDYAFASLMGVIFFVCALANSLIYDITEPPAAFVYTGIMLAFAALTLGIVMLVRHVRERK